MAAAYTLHIGKKIWQCDIPRVLGVINVTPDSFSDGGRFLQTHTAIDHAAQLIADGADMIDIGGESTRPNADAVSIEEELTRIVPVIEAIHARFSIPISVDTTKTAVMQAAIAAGAIMVNDVRALQDEGAVDCLAVHDNVAICLMHMQGTPKDMQHNPHYTDVVAEVTDFLKERLSICLNAGIAPERIIIDPGFGFGKTLAHNITLLQKLGILRETLGRPILIGVSRKSMIGGLAGDMPDTASRLSGSIAAALYGIMRGASVIRTHDVAETKQAVTVWHNLEHNSDD